jgi:Cytochrome c554 and c-prime
MRYSKRVVCASAIFCAGLCGAVGVLEYRTGGLFQFANQTLSTPQSHSLLPAEATHPEVLAPPGADLADFVGAEKCAECHSEIYEKQRRSHMANALATTEQYESRKGLLPLGDVRDTANQIQYDVVRRQSGLWLIATQGSRSAEAHMMYVLGSGSKGLSFVQETSNEFQELRLAFYRDVPNWDFTPGQEAVQLARLDLDAVLGTQRISRGEARTCLSCHSTLLVQTAGQIDQERSMFGVSCERCHGPGREHIESISRGEVTPPRNELVERELDRVAPTRRDSNDLAAVRQIQLCGECHGKGSSPADDLHLAQFQVPALLQSKCYQASSQQLRCSDCHDPHGNAWRGDPAPYVQVCISCHRGEHQSVGSVPSEGKTCPVNAQEGCIQCHMPRQQPIYRSSFTHHRIGIHPKGP